jgi:hypothetical protein
VTLTDPSPVHRSHKPNSSSRSIHFTAATSSKSHTLSPRFSPSSAYLPRTAYRLAAPRYVCASFTLPNSPPVSRLPRNQRIWELHTRTADWRCYLAITWWISLAFAVETACRLFRPLKISTYTNGEYGEISRGSAEAAFAADEMHMSQKLVAVNSGFYAAMLLTASFLS